MKATLEIESELDKYFNITLPQNLPTTYDTT